MLKKTIALLGLIAGFIAAAPAFGSVQADGATVYPYQDIYEDSFNWVNPCTWEPVVINVKLDMAGRYIVDGAGNWHFQDRAVSVDGYDSAGWIVDTVTVLAHREATGWVSPDDVTLAVWQIHFKVSDPGSGEFYTGMLTVQAGEYEVGAQVRVETSTITCNGVGNSWAQG